MQGTQPTTGHCSRCRGSRRLRFAGYATDGRENGVRPRAFYRSCETCGERMLVLADATDALGLVRGAIGDWKRATGVETHGAANPSLRTIDFDDLEGELIFVLWSLYSEWDPDRGVAFTAYAAGLLPRRLASYVRTAVGGDAVYRSNGRGLVRVWPKAHATSVCLSIDGAAAAAAGDDGDGGGREDRLAGSLGVVASHDPRDRASDLARLLAGGSR